jgi:uncharacterized protein (DUF1015 family)
VVDAAPFAAVRYDPRVAGDAATTSAPSYDDVEPTTYARHRTASPYTVLELLAGGADAEGYAAAGAALARWRRTGVLVRDASPALYLYEEHELRHGVPAVQRGVLAAVALEPLSPRSSILPHEDVDPVRVADRLERLSAVPVDVAPVFALHRSGAGTLAELLDQPARDRPVVAFSDADGTDHRIWAIREEPRVAAIRAALAEVRAVIADGHHRYATALAFADRQRAAGLDDAGGRAPWSRTLAYLVDVDAHGPRVQPVHRLLTGLAREALAELEGWQADAAPAAAEDLERAVEAAPDGAIGLVRHGAPPQILRPVDVTALRDRLPAGRSAAWRALPTALCDEVLVPDLAPTSIAHRSDAASAAAEVAATPGSALLVLPPVPPSTVLDLAEAGEPMPPKSTSFRPKPRTGLILRDVLDPAEEARALARLEGGGVSGP